MKKSYSRILFSSVLLFGLLAQYVLADEISEANALFEKNCTACHSIDKKLVGPAVNTMSTDPAILKSALTTDRVVLMQAVIKNLTSEEVTKLIKFIQSKHIATVPAQIMPAATGSSLAVLCQGCHGATGAGAEANKNMPAYPRLAGQIQTYLVQALNDYKNDIRNNPTMNAIAKGLSDKEINTLANYYSQLD